MDFVVRWWVSYPSVLRGDVRRVTHVVARFRAPLPHTGMNFQAIGMPTVAGRRLPVGRRSGSTAGASLQTIVRPGGFKVQSRPPALPVWDPSAFIRCRRSASFRRATKGLMPRSCTRVVQDASTCTVSEPEVSRENDRTSRWHRLRHRQSGRAVHVRIQEASTSSSATVAAATSARRRP